METLKPGERIALPARMTDEEIARILWPARYRVAAVLDGSKHLIVLGEGK